MLLTTPTLTADIEMRRNAHRVDTDTLVEKLIRIGTSAFADSHVLAWDEDEDDEEEFDIYDDDEDDDDLDEEDDDFYDEEEFDDDDDDDDDYDESDEL